MVFSATGNLLSGSVQRPDILTFGFVTGENVDPTTHQYIALEEGSSFRYRNGQVIVVGSITCKLNRWGYTPIASTITGLARVLLGIIHLIVHLVCAIFSRYRENHLQEASLGFKNIGRGLPRSDPDFRKCKNASG